MEVLVTGGAGFIGSHLVEGLLGSGHRVRVLDDFATGRAGNLRHLTSRVELLEATILDPQALRRAMEGIEVVFHEAAIPSVPRSVRNPILSNEVNITGTLNVLIAARDAGIRRLVYAASSSAYGSTPGQARVETMPTRPLSPYAVAKLAGEHYCQVFARIHNLETVCLRYFNVFGPRQDPDSEYAAVIPKFITALLGSRPLTIYGDGTQSRDFTYVGNVVAANLLAMQAPAASGEVFNVGCGQQTSLNELARQLGRIAGIEPQITYLPARSGDVPHSLADVSKARSLLGYEPAVSLTVGLRRTWECFASQSAQAPRPAARRSAAVAAP
jgi:UDP-N-acetylglucosamine/UDP-N-acetyl-alpha-D-glucosaminouronate 4-epimerase